VVGEGEGVGLGVEEGVGVGVADGVNVGVTKPPAFLTAREV